MEWGVGMTTSRSVAFEAIDTCIVWLARGFKVILGSYTCRGSNHLSQAAWLTSEWAISVLCHCVRPATSKPGV
jgi:hypothetical protein